MIVDHKESFEIILTGVQSELQVAKSEKDRLKNLWLESQKALVGEQAKSKQQTAEIEMLKVEKVGTYSFNLDRRNWVLLKESNKKLELT